MSYSPYKSSLYFNLNDFMILEYVYHYGNSDKIVFTDDVKLEIVDNSYIPGVLVINNRDSALITNNTRDTTATMVDDGRYVSLDEDGRDYTATDNNVKVLQFTPAGGNIAITYETIRIHLLSGYNMQDVEGFIANIHITGIDGKTPLYLASHLVLKQDMDNFYFSPSPLRLSDRIFDKYIEFSIIRPTFLMEQQAANPNGITLAKQLLGQKVKEQNLAYCEFITIGERNMIDGFTYLRIAEQKTLAFECDNKFNLLQASVVEKESWFELSPMWNGQGIEDFIFQLNSVPGNSYYILHEINVVEQYSTRFESTNNLSFIQTDNYDTPFPFRPILRNKNGSAVSFAIDYTVRLYNRIDGRSIYVNTSHSSYNVNAYSMQLHRINVGNTHEPIRVFNKINVTNTTINDTSNTITQNKVVAYFVDAKNIIFNTGDTAVDNKIKITSFTSIVKFLVTKKDGSVNDVSYLNSPAICFIKDSGEKVYVEEYKHKDFDKTSGVLAFKITQSVYGQLKLITDKKYYVINIGINGEESILYNNIFELT
jgi:hypothetical protein